MGYVQLKGTIVTKFPSMNVIFCERKPGFYTFTIVCFAKGLDFSA